MTAMAHFETINCHWWLPKETQMLHEIGFLVAPQCFHRVLLKKEEEADVAESVVSVSEALGQITASTKHGRIGNAIKIKISPTLCRTL